MTTIGSHGKVQIGDEDVTDLVEPTLTLTMRDRLSTIFHRQRALQAHLHDGVDPADFEPEERSRYIKDQMLALMDELHEMLAEMAWKPWSSDKTKFNRDAYIREAVDAMHFLVNLVLAAGATADEFYAVFMEKNDVNWNRHMKPGESYNASEGKCPCGRALDDYPGQNVNIRGTVYHNASCELIPSVKVS
jgi:hypothetical protein